jgi:hypothetical protein
MLAAAIRLVASHITPDHREAARRKLEVFGRRSDAGYGRSTILPMTLRSAIGFRAAAVSASG